MEDQLWNASVQGNNAANRKNAFLTWCDQWATPQLGNHFPDSEDLFGELADSHYRVMQTPKARHANKIGLASDGISYL